jgi:TonB-linked SusC/RagA family outer membrane protein
MQFRAQRVPSSRRRHPNITKTLLVMKFTCILLMAGFLHVSARSISQTVHFSGKNVPLEKVFAEVKKQTGYSFLYPEPLLSGTRPVTIEADNLPLEAFLQLLFRNQPIEYEITSRSILLSPKVTDAATADKKDMVPPPSGDIHGRVTDTAGNPLVGASVAVKGTTMMVSTNAKGEFTLTGADERSTVVVSYVGYNTAELKLTGRENYRMSIALRHNNNPLDEVQVIGYGTNTKRFNVGSVSTVNADIIEKQPVTNILLALEGQAPGLAINATSGVPGSRVQLQVRGQNTILSNSSSFKPYDQPLFIIDGVPFAPQNQNISQLSNLAAQQSFNGGINQSDGLSPFNGINPADIESISILKDADATSIYGTQGSNGVVLITTKKGKPGKTTLNLMANTGINSDARTVKMMNTQQYLQMRKDAFATDGVTATSTPGTTQYAPDLTIFDQNKYTDWQKVIFGNTSSNTDIHASLSGGTYTNTFLISAGYTRSDYNFPGDYADQRMTLHSAMHHGSQDNRLSLDFGVDYGYDQNTSPAFGGGQKITLAPNTPDLLDASGNLVWSYKGVDLSSYQFYQYLKQPTELQNYNLGTTLHIAYKLLPGLSISANLGYSRNTSNEHSEKPLSSQPPLSAQSNAQFAENNFQTVNVEPQLDYTANIGKGVLTALMGATYKKNSSYANTLQGYGYANDNFLGSINGAATVYAFDNTDIYKYNAGFARLKYVYDQKYILSLTGRRDGSSNFGPGHQFGDFGSVGAGWIFSEEKAFKKTLPFISFAKLSGSYGTSGSDGIASYQYQAFWAPLTYVPAFQNVKPNKPQNLYNPDYSWALKKSLNVALDLGFFHDRLLLNATYYRDREGNQLGGYPLPVIAGFTSVLENLPAVVQNKGWEFSFTSSNVKTKGFSWTTNFNIALNRNKLLSFPNLAASSYNQEYIIGKPTSIIFGYRYADVNPTTGLFEFYDQHGELTSKPKYGLASTGGDEVPIADREVKYMGGLGNTFSYKHVSLYAFFQFSSQTAPSYLSEVYGTYRPGTGVNNEPVAIASRYWKNPGDHAALQRLGSSYASASNTAAGDFSSSTGVYGDDTYMRLKTLAISYDLPQAWMKRIHMRDCRIFLNAQNLLTFTNYKVSDPELFSDYTSFPIQRIVSVGLNINL